MMHEPVEAYPLHWPAGWPRTAEHDRVRGRFNRQERQYSSSNPGSSWMRKRDMTVAEGVSRVQEALTRLGVESWNVIISSNLRTRNDGLPRSGAAEPDDPGIAVYWQLDGERQCMAIDNYIRTADNLAAIAATIEAMRAIERHGGAQILRRAFQGFKALPSTTSSQLSIDAAWGGDRTLRRRRAEAHEGSCRRWRAVRAQQDASRSRRQHR